MSSDRSNHWLRAVAAHVDLDLELSSQPDKAEFRRAWQLVVAACRVSDEQFTHRVARHFRIGVADLSSWDPQAVRLLPPAVARTHAVLPLSLTDSNVMVATSDPQDGAARRDIVAHTSRQPLFLLASPSKLGQAIDRAYATPPSGRSALQTLVAEVASDEFSVVASDGRGRFTSFALEAPAVVKLTDVVLQQAVRYRATEIHLQPGRERCRVRYRIDGVLQHLVDLPPQAHERLVARLKHLAFERLDADGTLAVEHGDRKVEGHLTTTATPDGEMVAIRLIAPEATPSLDGLGFDEAEAEAIRRAVGLNDGLILVSGPARSGKTTFIHAALVERKRLNVVSLENSVERILPGVTQIQYDHSRGRSFAETVGDLLAQDPDLIHAGELRDLATARIALRAAVTGRKVLASVHTTDAVSGIRRLVDMGLAPGRLGESLKAVVSLRLLRRLCPDCAAVVRDPSDLPSRERKLAETAGVMPLRRAVGCSRCAATGYREQIPLAEVLTMTPRLRALLDDDPTDEEIARAARGDGMRSFDEGAMARVRRGDTTLEEVRRVLGVVPPRDETTGSVGPVLIVEDEASDRLLIRTTLEGIGFRVVEAEDGPAALEVVAEADEDISLVLLDLFMPDMHGLEVLRRVRGSLATQALPVIVLTSSQELRDEIELLEAGADDFLQKPIIPERLEARVRAVLRRTGVQLGEV